MHMHMPIHIHVHVHIHIRIHIQIHVHIHIRLFLPRGSFLLSFCPFGVQRSCFLCSKTARRRSSQDADVASGVALADTVPCYAVLGNLQKQGHMTPSCKPYKRLGIRKPVAVNPSPQHTEPCILPGASLRCSRCSVFLSGWLFWR